MVKNKHKFTLLTIIQALCFIIFAHTATAEEDKKACRPPRLRSIQPENHAEVPPESEFSFTLPRWTDPEKVTLTVKKIPTEVTVENHNSFFLVKGKLPASLENTYARVSVRAVTDEDVECMMRDGWLLKISERTGSDEEEPSDQ